MTDTPAKRSRHGLTRAMVRIKLDGMGAIDKRMAAGRDLLQWKNDLLAALGGSENVTPQKMALVDLACRTKALLDHADAYLLTQRSIINRRKKAFLPIVAQRQTLVGSLSSLLGQIGLERQEKPVKPLSDYINEREAVAEGDSAE